MTDQGNPQFTAACLARGWSTQGDIAQAYEQHAALLGETASITVRQVRRWESATPGWPNTLSRRILTSMFGTPLQELGFTPPRTSRNRPPLGTAAKAGGRTSMRRRSFLHGVLGAAPLWEAGQAERLEKALSDARRYSDRALVIHLRAALDEAARADGRTGPRQTLPAALDILAVIEELLRESRSPVRRDLLALGARAAEFTAFLHRDGGAPEQATLYFHDRAAEMATFAADGPMHAYVLLRKAQATGRDDAGRMLDFASAAAHGPFPLPPRARAEALQQQARALALTGARTDDVARALDQAHAELDIAPPPEPATCTGPLCAGYGLDRLLAQAAISYREAGQAAKAVDLLQTRLPHARFAPRDQAFFTAHLAGALAAAGEVDQAAATGMTALTLAAGPGFGQALDELRRTAGALRPYARRPAVRELRHALTAVTV
ncbi:XRE family transcriptional regulator [Streptomyces sp. NPDC089919]|uniref:XRE family transcriptional regulator n=1 Tax=Streptomyces sp. NPDC089919 TaxID=3155188 RepID=UPI003438C45C